MTPPAVLSNISACLLATAPPLDDPLKGALVLWVLGGLAATAVAANHIRQFFLSFRQTPPAADVFCTRREHRELEGQVNGLRGEVTAIRSTLSNELRSIHRALGRIEGALGTISQDGLRDNQ